MGAPRRVSTLLLVILGIVLILNVLPLVRFSVRSFNWRMPDFEAMGGGGGVVGAGRGRGASREAQRQPNFGNGYLIFVGDKADWTNFEAIVQVCCPRQFISHPHGG